MLLKIYSAVDNSTLFLTGGGVVPTLYLNAFVNPILTAVNAQIVQRALLLSSVHAPLVYLYANEDQCLFIANPLSGKPLFLDNDAYEATRCQNG